MDKKRMTAGIISGLLQNKLGKGDESVFADDVIFLKAWKVEEDAGFRLEDVTGKGVAEFAQVVNGSGGLLMLAGC